MERTHVLFTDAGRVHEEGDVLFAGLLHSPGSVPHTKIEECDNLPQCCVVRFLI